MNNHNFIDNYQHSHIIITNDFNTELNLLKNTHDINSLRIFGYDEQKGEFTNELKIEDSHAIIQECYIATSATKIIAIFAYSYNSISQNALLKVLEEPPANINFIFFINSKNKLIPTIFSRLACFDKRKKDSISPFSLDVKRLNIPMIYEYTRTLESQNLSSENGRKILTSLLFSIANANISLSHSDLERFDNAIKSLHSRQSVHLAILPILLGLIKS